MIDRASSPLHYYFTPYTPNFPAYGYESPPDGYDSPVFRTESPGVDHAPGRTVSPILEHPRKALFIETESSSPGPSSLTRAFAVDPDGNSFRFENHLHKGEFHLSLPIEGITFEVFMRMISAQFFGWSGILHGHPLTPGDVADIICVRLSFAAEDEFDTVPTVRNWYQLLRLADRRIDVLCLIIHPDELRTRMDATLASRDVERRAKMERGRSDAEPMRVPGRNADSRYRPY